MDILGNVFKDKIHANNRLNFKQAVKINSPVHQFASSLIHQFILFILGLQTSDFHFSSLINFLVDKLSL
jgi:hypothetical protein